MTVTSCRSCNRVCRDAFICRTCERLTRRRLGAQAHLALELEVTMTRQAKLGNRGDGGKSAETPVPFSPLAAEVLRDQRNILVGWCRLLSEEGIGDLPADDIAAMADRINLHMPDLRRHEAAGDLVGELATLTERAVRAIDLPVNRLQFVAGPCPEVAGDGPCPGEVLVTVPIDNDIPPVARCVSCAQEWDARQWLRMGREIAARQERERAQKALAESFRIRGA